MHHITLRGVASRCTVLHCITFLTITLQCIALLMQVLEAQFSKMTRLHGEMSQQDRMDALAAFRKEPHGVLVATDVASRGLDIKGQPFDFSRQKFHELPRFI